MGTELYRIFSKRIRTKKKTRERGARTISCLGEFCGVKAFTRVMTIEWINNLGGGKGSLGMGKKGDEKNRPWIATAWGKRQDGKMAKSQGMGGSMGGRKLRSEQWGRLPGGLTVVKKGSNN